MATPGHEPRPGQATSTGTGANTSGISPATTNASMTGATPGVSTNPSSTDTSRTTPSSTTGNNPTMPDTGMSSGDMARAASSSDSSASTGFGSSRSSSGHDTDELRQQARSTGETIKNEARRTAEALKDEARETVRQVADRQKQAAAGEMAGISRALRRAADELEGHSHLPVDRYVRQAAQGLDSLSESLSRRDVGNVVSRLEQYTREQPMVVFGGAMVAGFLLARLLRGPSTPSTESGGYRTDRFDNDVYH